MTTPAEEKPMSPEDARLNLQWINHLLDDDPHNTSLWTKKAAFFHDAMVNTIPRKARLERVLLWYHQCLREEPENWACHYNYAVTLRELNRHEEALRYIRTAVRLNPRSAFSQELLIKTLIRLGLQKQAFDVYQDAVRMGCALDSSILGQLGTGQPATDKLKEPSFKPIDQSTRRRYQDLQGTKEKLLKGEMTFAMELGDPELFTLQCEVDELTYLGMYQEAEELCIQFDLEHGTNNVTQTFFAFYKHMENVSQIDEKAEISAAFPLLDIATQHFSFEYLGIVNKIFSPGGTGKFIKISDINDFDEQIRWQLGRINVSNYSFNNLSLAFQPIPAGVLIVWNMAVLNFIVARKVNVPVLVAYAATTLAEVYDKIGDTNLPYILYSVSAKYADKARQADYFVNANGKCAMILMKNGQFGPAINHLEKSLKYADQIIPLNRYQLYEALSECYFNLADYAKARFCKNKALDVQEIPDKYKEDARLAAGGAEAIEKGEVAFIGYPPVLCEGLTVKSFKYELPNGSQYLSYTSKHELYDSLLQAYDNVFRTRQTVFERGRGFAYFQAYAELSNALVRSALEVDLPANALMHLESQKTIILNNRLKYLLREKPVELPDALWDQLQRLVKLYRRMVEQSPEANLVLEDFVDLTPAILAESIEGTLWQCSQVAEASAKQIQQKLAVGRLPEKIECADPEHSLILEFGPGCCFIIHPDNLENPEVIELPLATSNEGEQLAHELFAIVQEWLDHYSQSTSLSAAPSSDRFNRFIFRLNEVLYQPIASKLDETLIYKLCIIPSRILHVLPLNLLGLLTHPDGCLCERFEVSFAPSLTCLQNLLNPIRKKPEQCMIVANSVPQCPPVICRNPNHDCFSMEGALNESKMIDALMKNSGIQTVCLEGIAATLDAVSAGLGSADIVHIAAHGLFNASEPENSGILLSLPGNGSNGKGPYVLHDSRMNSQPSASAVGEMLTLDHLWQTIDMFCCNLLNLSACSTAMVDWSERSDEFYGIANGFLYAGVQNILTNLWPVNDTASQIFNLRFYETLLSQNCTPAAALKIAVEQLKKCNSEENRAFAHPFFWGGYRLVGFS